MRSCSVAAGAGGGSQADTTDVRKPSSPAIILAATVLSHFNTKCVWSLVDLDRLEQLLGELIMVNSPVTMASISIAISVVAI